MGFPRAALQTIFIIKGVLFFTVGMPLRWWLGSKEAEACHSEGDGYVLESCIIADVEFRFGESVGDGVELASDDMAVSGEI